MQQCQAIFENFDPNTMSICCVPTICHVDNPILLENLSDSVKVTCNNEGCLEGKYMHKVCFDQWECSVLTFLRSTGRARSWSERQRLQNLWTKKGYDLSYKACGCKCGKGHLRKDLDWSMPTTPLEDPNKKKKHRKKKNDKPSLSVQQVPSGRIRSSSMSSMSSGSPPASSDCPLSPTWSDSIFTRRQDFSSFNTLPPNKINSYHIKIEDEGNQGNDEIRCFILSTLSANKTVGITCILCFSQMIIFDRYPLIDGTFFISPLQYSKTSIPVKTDCQFHYLNAICMSCLEGWNAILICKFCQRRWDGSDLILGTMYSYDVIAAIPCCEDRQKCNNCHRVIVLLEQKLNFFSDYSRNIPCPNCSAVDFHFIKPLATYYVKNNSS